jgi:RimJ/RimL family protein N-acetyltransferase
MYVRRLDEKDLQLRVKWMNDPIVYCSMHYDIPITMDKTVQWFHNNLGNNRRVDLTVVEDDITVAFGGLTNIDRDVNKAELYIFVNPKVQKCGFGSRATLLLCKYGFEELGLNKIYLETNEDNVVARHVYEKCGFRLEGTLREEYKTKDSRLLSRMYYGLIKSDIDG